ncbi:D-alanyl-D-alanine carboxypeptidase / D-alanyl-D-alanine-endopeptidase (penicillin-binding protein 4) [Methylophilus rhizosphaerae]|uniref:D-alanyl-D-alanine carboxypeptidase / D-alanyl-D-alanine-endopeptidase (Penicillin-binding protein 4) n=1 Tax=Methylophilus rhizosphaerae TaxID=492660 RepID=A0A1G9D217_9PROT|nr:D-alanyl-D-alanine carboxypeptidase/D-alanyl-D-alanine-endopeptidase [Methylophilus rhizosphaerae]SDK57843.1 D-alanyl-D-alanine carboxypeptidase / D-alanyl-D-alanine-endopeptidase (penicillin-binding protein 4) [Methylophilus rhizosphaerae]
MRWLLSGLFLCVSLAHAALPASLQEALTKAQLPAESVAIVIQPLDGNVPLISHNASKPMNPASVMKVVTTYAALEALTPAYRWKTEVYRNGPVSQGVLDGDIILKGYGDPSLNVAEFWQLLQQVQQQGIRQIKGNLILDTSVYAPEVSQRPVLDDEPWRAYNANPNALLINGRHTSFRFGVSTTSIKPAVNIAQEFELSQISIVNLMQVRKGACGDWRSDLRYAVSPTAEGATVTFSGTLPEQCDERYLELSVLNDTQYTLFTFGKLWAQLGGQFNGQAATGVTPPNANLVTTWWSAPLDAVIRDLNKWSNNVMARQVMLTIGLEAGLAPVDENAAALALKNTLRMRGLSFPELVLENGSGLSRNERISAEHLAQLLVTAYQRPVMPVLMASLPILGLDGTLKKRLPEPPSQGMAYLKTGSLEGVSSIAGYVQDRQGKRYVLVMMVNHPHASAARAVQDGLIKGIVEGR